MAVKILRFGSDQPKEDFAVINIVRQQERRVKSNWCAKGVKGECRKLLLFLRRNQTAFFSYAVRVI